MDRYERSELKSDIRVSKLDNFNHILEFLNVWFPALFNSAITFGPNSNAVKETFKTIQEIRKINKAENSIYAYLTKHAHVAYNDAVGVYLEELFELSEKTFDYYLTFLDEILVACDLKQEHRIIREKKDFQTLIESNEFFSKLLEVLIDENDILEFIEATKSFLDFFDEHNLRVIYIDFNNEQEKEFIGVNYKVDNKGLIQDIKLYVPEVINLETAKIYLYTCYQAFKVYQKMNSSLSDDEIEKINIEAKDKMNDFEIAYREKEKELLPYK